MNRLYQLTFTLCMLLGVHTMAYAQGKQSETRGDLLYSTHCNACHTSQINWRKQKLVTDWSSLVAQVRRWQYVTGLSWSEEEIIDVAHYLNAVYYRFINTAQGKKPDQILFKD